MAELLVWTGGDRDALNPMERFDGYVTAIKDDGHVWGKGDLTNHRVVQLPGVEPAAVQYLLDQLVVDDIHPVTGKNERKVIGRRRVLLSPAITSELKALRGDQKTVVKNATDVGTGLRDQ